MNEIATPHWKACKTCRHHGEKGCNLVWISIDYDSLMEAIICEDYIENEEE